MQVAEEKADMDLLYSINQMRKQMLQIAELRGLQNYETVRKSKELDTLIVRYQKQLLCHS